MYGVCWRLDNIYLSVPIWNTENVHTNRHPITDSPGCKIWKYVVQYASDMPVCLVKITVYCLYMCLYMQENRFFPNLTVGSARIIDRLAVVLEGAVVLHS